jgi:protein gp37
MRDLLSTKLRGGADESHIWWGVSVENRRHGLPRIEHLRPVPARMRFLSVEPLLEDLGPLDLGGIDWVIVGGERGYGARPMDPGWVRSIRDQCRSAGVPFCFKQWGGFNKKIAGRELDGLTFDEIPERSDHPMPGLARRREMIGEVQRSWTGTVPHPPGR